MSNVAHSKITHLYEAAETGGKREAILNAALELFTERGFHGTAMPLVAELAGVGAGTIYRYFASKEALVNVLYQYWNEFQLVTITRDVPGDIPLRDQFHIYWKRLVDFARDYPVAFAFLELHYHAPYLDEKSRAIEEQGHTALVGFFEECLRQRVARKASAEVLASIVWGAYVSLIRAARNGRFEITQDVIDQSEQCCWDAIKR